jgi:D-arabinose 1-dehydrogenase-like Zn-dependent alcohol dehydrogenase
MTQTPALAAPSAGAALAPTRIDRRELRPDDVLIDIAYAGVCHTDNTDRRVSGARTSSPWCLATRLPAPYPP